MLVNSYEGLIKDKAIIAAEVMHEYDEKVCISCARSKQMDLPSPSSSFHGLILYGRTLL